LILLPHQFSRWGWVVGLEEALTGLTDGEKDSLVGYAKL
jgi:hypothetical protein